jgi:hypothetical protein
MNYLSDDEDNTNTPTEPTFDELYPQFDEEIDEEMMEIIKKHANKEDNFSYQVIEKEKTILQKDNLKKDKLKKNKTLTEFIKEEEDKKPKKWSSNRADNKKKNDDTPKIIKRQFNPRLPPFRIIEKKHEIETKINNLEEGFPNLIT